MVSRIPEINGASRQLQVLRRPRYSYEVRGSDSAEGRGASCWIMACSVQEVLGKNTIGQADSAKTPFVKNILDNSSASDVCVTVNVLQEEFKTLQSTGFFK